VSPERDVGQKEREVVVHCRTGLKTKGEII